MWLFIKIRSNILSLDFPVTRYMHFRLLYALSVSI
jgi:hypothetical protein